MRFTCCRCWSASIGAVAVATALLNWRLAPVWQQAPAALAKHTRQPDQEWVRSWRGSWCRPRRCRRMRRW